MISPFLKLAVKAKGVGLEFLQENKPELMNQICFSTIVNRDQSQAFMDLMLDAGAPGLNVSYARFIETDADEHVLAHANINHEYASIRCITDQTIAQAVAHAIEVNAEQNGLQDLCVLAHCVPRIAKYVHGATEHRVKPKRFALAR